MCEQGLKGGGRVALRPPTSGLCGNRTLLVFRVSLEDQVANRGLCGGVDDRSQQREGAAFTVDGVRTGREGDIAPAAPATLPDPEADQLQAGQR